MKVASNWAVALLLAVASCGDDGGGSSGSSDGPAPVSTLAYVTTRCHEGKGGVGWSASQALWIRQGDHEPVKIVEFTSGQPSIGGFCRLWAQGRSSLAAYALGVFQRMGFTADGLQFLFEVTDDFSVNTSVVPEDEQGLFAVGIDGTGLHKVAAHSETPCFRIYWPCVLAAAAPECMACGAANFQCAFGVSPDGHRIAYTDLGPSATGEQASQVFTLDLVTGERVQVTHLPPVPSLPTCTGQETDCVFPSKHPISIPQFLRRSTIRYDRGGGCSVSGGGTFTVKTDGTEEPKAVPVVALPNGAVLPILQITGQPVPIASTVPGVPENGPGVVVGNAISEIFVIEPPDTALLPQGRVLQLTNFGRSDTYLPDMSGRRVLFNASTNHLGTNPSNQCQLFSIDRLGGDLRQLTFFGASGDTPRNCQDYGSPGCTLANDIGLDRVTGALLFNSTCDPLGLNPSGVEQAFAIRPDGGGLTQLTRTAGIVRHADGSIDVEMAKVFPGGAAR